MWIFFYNLTTNFKNCRNSATSEPLSYTTAQSRNRFIFTGSGSSKKKSGTAKTKEKYEDNFFFKTWKCTFSGVIKSFFCIAFCFSFKTIEAQMLFWSVFFKTQKKLLIAKNGQNSIFDGQYLFYVRFQKYRPEEHLCIYCL